MNYAVGIIVRTILGAVSGGLLGLALWTAGTVVLGGKHGRR